jgi:ribonuclease BN (tRNA processing enzyme)
MLPSEGVVLDAGTALFRVREHLQTDELHVFITHAHLDHVVGLTYLLDLLDERRTLRITVHGEAAKLDAVRRHLFSEPLFPVIPPLKFQPLRGETRLPGQGRLNAFPLAHPGGALGFRLDWNGRSLAYVTDTTAGPDADYADLVQRVDLLIHECYFTDDMQDQARLTGHSCVTAVAELAARAQVGRLLLVHVNPQWSDGGASVLATAQATFPRTQLGADHMQVDF